MSDFENFLCFSSATAQRCGMGTAEARDRINKENAEEKGREEREKRPFFFSLSPRVSPPQSPLFRLRSSRSTPLHRRRGKTKKVFKIAHIIWPLMKETKNVSKSIIYEGNDRILLSESNLRSGFALSPPQFPFHTAAPSQRKNKESFQNRSYHLAIDERNEKRI